MSDIEREAFDKWYIEEFGRSTTADGYESSITWSAWKASRQAVEGEPIAWMFQHEETGQTQCVDSQQVEWGFEANNPRLQMIGPLYTHPAIAVPLQFGNGKLVVTDGSCGDVPAVFISPAMELDNTPDTALSGKDAERRTDMLYGDETVLLFNTAEHASVVAGALIRGKVASANVPEEWRKTMKELADDLESEVEARRSGELDRRIERDLLIVKEARALLASQEVDSHERR